MSAATKEKVSVPVKTYTMPQVHVSDWVVYYGDAVEDGAHGSPALVLSKSVGSVELRVELSEGRQKRIYDVLHVTDPRLEIAERREKGAWGYSRQQVTINELESRVAALEELLTKK